MHHQLTSDHGPVSMYHCIFFGINPRVTLHHAFRLYCVTIFIPVGWVLSTAVAVVGVSFLGECLPRGVSAQSSVCLGGCQLGSVCWVGCLLGVSAQVGGASHHALEQTPPPVNRITDACENITFLQLLLWKLMNVSCCSFFTWMSNCVNGRDVLHMIFLAFQKCMSVHAACSKSLITVVLVNTFL